MAAKDPDTGENVPASGDWPVPPQEDVPLSDDRIWIDGCFDFFHHGHAGVMLQARQLGNELLVGLHSDKDIEKNKGPTVMNLAERTAAVDACRWSTLVVPHAPYVTSLPWITHYGCRYVVHGDDITSDASGNDCYRFVKKADRMKIVKRTPGISTTDLVGRMLLCTKSHFIRNLEEYLMTHKENEAIMRHYATDGSGRKPEVEVWNWHPKYRSRERRLSSVRSDQSNDGLGKGSFSKMVEGRGPRNGQRIVYVDGGFDLFSSGHIAFLKQVVEIEEQLGKERCWDDEEVKSERIKAEGEDYPPAFVIAGMHDDDVINHWKGINYPIMNIFERGLCVVQCKYVSSVIFAAPYVPSKTYLHDLPYGLPDAIYHGPTAFMSGTSDLYSDAKVLNIYIETPAHDFQHVNAGEIVARILQSRERFEERQRKKGLKGLGEEASRKREMEKEAEAERERRLTEVERQFGA